MLETLEKSSGKTPPALRMKPDYDPFIDWYVRVFWRLRNLKAETERLSLNDILLYACHIDCISDVDEFIDIIHSMDKVFLRVFAKAK